MSHMNGHQAAVLLEEELRKHPEYQETQDVEYLLYLLDIERNARRAEREAAARNFAAVTEIAQRLAAKEEAGLLPLIVGPQDVYFVADEQGRIKIGVAKSVPQRLAALQTASATPLRLLGVIPGGGMPLEKLLHARFSDHRIRAEWFSADILDDVQKLLDVLGAEEEA